MTAISALAAVASVAALALPCAHAARLRPDQEAHVASLVANMTNLAKANQLQLWWGNKEVLVQGAGQAVNYSALASQWAGGVAGFVHDLYDPGVGGISLINELQAWARNNSPADAWVPIMFIEEGLHGVLQAGKTVFPQSIAMGATWDVPLMGQIAAMIAQEARAYGIVEVFAPVIGGE
jgi:beta-glucosidase-like glycosyl hydrolase